MAEIIVGALLLRRLLGPNAAMDRVEQVGGMLAALAVATAISATVGTISMVAGGVVDALGRGRVLAHLVARRHVRADLSSCRWCSRGLSDPVGAWRRIRDLGGRRDGRRPSPRSALLAFSSEEPIRYVVFPALIWAAFRFGRPGATLAIAITAGVAIGVTANDVGPFFKQTIDHHTLSTQLYIWVAALTTLFLSGVVCERERSARELAEARRTEGERAVEERRRIARDLHDSVSQALFSTVLHTRAAEKALAHEGAHPRGAWDDRSARSRTSRGASRARFAR